MSDENQKRIFSRNLTFYLDKYQKTQREVAESIGVSPQTFNTWCQGIALPRMGKLQRLADYFRVEKSALIDERSTNSAYGFSAKRGIRIPVLGRVAAGIPIEAIEETIDTEEISEDLARRGTYFGLRIKGDSMSPHIMNGDTVIVRQQNDAETDDIVIAIVNGNDGVCKKLKKTSSGVMLISLNPVYDPIVFTEGEMDEIPVRIVGKVVELRRKI